MVIHETIDDLLQSWDEWLLSLGWSLPMRQRVTGTLWGGDIIENLEATAVATIKLLSDGGDFNVFRRRWKWARLAAPLRVRLGVEQVLWDMGSPWRVLITGFRAIEGDEGRTGVFGRAPIGERSGVVPASQKPKHQTTSQAKASRAKAQAIWMAHEYG